MRDPDELFERDLGDQLRSYARSADRSVDPASIAAQAAALGGPAGAPGPRPFMFRAISGVAWAGLLVGVLIVALLAIVAFGGRSNQPVDLVSPSPSASASPSASLPVVVPPSLSPAPSASASAAPSETASPTAAPTATASASAPSSAPTTSPTPPATPSPTASAAGERLPTDFSAMSVTFVSANEGWVLGNVGCSAGRCPAIGHTLDAGHTWTAIPAPATTVADSQLPVGEATSGISQIRFADPKNGWAFGPELWSTHDGGQTWTKVQAPVVPASSVVALETARGLTTAVVDEGQGTFAIATSPTTVDHFESSLTLQAGAGPVPTIQLVLNGDTGWILQNDRTVVNGAQLVGGVWKTWTPACLNVVGPAYLAASSATDLTAACDVGLLSNPQGGHLYVSTNGGASFTEHGVKIPVTLGDQIATPTTSTVVVSGTSGDKGVLEASFDGGAAWSTVLDLGADRATYIGFTTPLQGVAIQTSSTGAGHLLMTRDGGHTWAAVAF